MHAERYYSSIVADVNALDLNQIVGVADPNADEMPGRLSGKAIVLVSAANGGLGGEVDLRLTESDLVGSKVVQTLYGGLNRGLGRRTPAGVGRVRLQLDGKTVNIASFAYFNRGVDIRGAGRIEDWSLGAASPVAGYAVGSTRILKDIQLPGVRELDRLMASFTNPRRVLDPDRGMGKKRRSLAPSNGPATKRRDASTRGHACLCVSARRQVLP